MGSALALGAGASKGRQQLLKHDASSARWMTRRPSRQSIRAFFHRQRPSTHASHHQHQEQKRAARRYQRRLHVTSARGGETDDASHWHLPWTTMGPPAPLSAYSSRPKTAYA